MNYKLGQLAKYDFIRLEMFDTIHILHIFWSIVGFSCNIFPI